MERKEGIVKIEYVKILWSVMTVLVCVVPCRATIVNEQNSPYSLEMEVLDNIYVTSGGTLKIMPGGYAEYGVYVDVGGTLELYGSHQYSYDDTAVMASVSAIVKLFTGSVESIKWNDENPPFDDPTNPTKIIADGSIGKLTWDYDGNTYSLKISTLSDIAIEVVGSEDPIEMIQDLIGDVLALNLQNGIENSLDAKLDAALNALDDVNENNNVAAINTLQAFISAVEAQSGNKIPAENAADLITAAQEIIALLST